MVVAGLAVLFDRGVGPLPNPEGCTARVGGVVVDLSTEQAQNAAMIAAVAVRRGLPARAASIALATAFQESKLRNLDHGDRDSVGLFQQRPSQGWGTAAQIRRPYYSINKFYDELQKVDGYQTMRITEAAQKVQRSGFPEAYEDHAADSRALASALTGYSPARFSCVVDGNSDVASQPAGRSGLTARAQRVRRNLHRAFGDLPLGLRAGRRLDGASAGLGALRRQGHRRLRAADQRQAPTEGLGNGVVPRRPGVPAGHRPHHLRQADLVGGRALGERLARLRPRRRTRQPGGPRAPRPRACRRGRRRVTVSW